MGRAAIGVFVISTAVLLAACTSIASYTKPAAPMPDRFPIDVDVDAMPSAARVGWRDFFTDEDLRQLIAAAVEHNRDIRIAAGRVAEARAIGRIQGSAPYPQLDAVAAASRSRTPADLSSTGKPFAATQLAAQLRATWEIDFWGRLHHLNEAARYQLLSTEEARRAVATDVVAQVANGYLLERELDERSGLARRTLVTREESLRILRRRYEVGSGSRLEMTQAQLLHAQAQTALHAIEQEREVNRNALQLLVGHRVVEMGAGTASLDARSAAIAIPAGLPSELLARRPDILAREYSLRAADANLAAVRAAFFPSVSLTGAFGSASKELDGLFRSGSSFWSFVPSVTLPLFNAGRLAAERDAAQARQVLAIAEYEKTVQAAFRDVSDALVRRRQIGLQIASSQTTLQVLRERARLAQLQFDNGRSAYLEVLDAQRDLFEAEQTMVQLRRAEMATGVALYAALGGGFAVDTVASPPSPIGPKP